MQNALQLSEVETEMMEEVFHVFSKYADKTRSFGVNLVHSHFALNTGEILYETHNKNTRVLTTRPINRDSFKKIPLATAWHKTNDKKIVISMFCCDSGDDSGDDGGIDISVRD